MSIEISSYYYNAETHAEIAAELNSLASRKNVQVSRWVNNSKGRQIVTYIVHEGERNQFASKQENVLFKTSVDAGRGKKVYDETAMLAEVRQFLNSIAVDEPELFEITDDSFGDSEPATFEQVVEIVNDMLEINGWSFSTERMGDEIRVYAERTDDENYELYLGVNWVMMNAYQGYLVVAKLAEVVNV